MRKLLTLLGVGIALTLIFGCSDSPPTVNAPVDHAAIELVPRPEFIETRPDAAVQAAIPVVHISVSERMRPAATPCEIWVGVKGPAVCPFSAMCQLAGGGGGGGGRSGDGCPPATPGAVPGLH